MKKTIYLLLFFYLICLTCKKTTKKEEEKPMVCDGSPLELSWIKDIIAGKGECTTYKGASLTMYASEKETLFLFEQMVSSIAICNYAIYDCSGKRVSPLLYTPDDRRQFLATHTNGIIIWQKN